MWHIGRVQDQRCRGPQLNPGVAKKKISHLSNQNNTTTNLPAPELNTWNCQRWKPEVAMAQWETVGLEIHRSPVQTLVWPESKSLTVPIRTIPPPMLLYHNVISKIVIGEHQKLMWQSGRMQYQRCRGPHLKPWCGQKENLSQVQSEQYYHQSLCTRVKYVKLSDVKIRSWCGTVAECSTRDAEVLSLIPGVAKKKISHRSNHNNIITNTSAPELNTWNCQRWNPEVIVAQWYSAGPEIQKSPVQTLVWSKKLLQVQSEQYHHQSLCTRVKYLKLSEVKTRRFHGTVVECRTRDPEGPSSNLVCPKRKSLKGPIRAIPPPIPLHQS